MLRISSPDQLDAWRAELLAATALERQSIAVCGGTGCRVYGSEDVWNAFNDEIVRQGVNVTVEHTVKATGCHGFCEKGPLVVIRPQGVFYTRVGVKDVPEIVAETIINDRIIRRLLYTDPHSDEAIEHEEDVPFYKYQHRLILGLNGNLDPTRIDEYVAHGGYASLSKVLTTMSPEEVITTVKSSGLRGRGGAGFPTGTKWQLCRENVQVAGTGYIICNADEGDPGAYMDRSIVEGNPHAVIEGMVIGAYAMGIQRGYIYIRAEYPLAVKNLGIAIRQVKEAGLLGENILGSGFDFTLDIRLGAGAFVCGEETALIASIEGRIGEPRSRPPYPAECGLWGKPTNINNVKSWSAVPIIIAKGAEWYASIGTEKSKGTMIFSVVGNINNTGLVEVPMGISLRELIFDIGGGIPKGKAFKAAQIGGPSGGCIPTEHLDVQIDYESLKGLGAIMGSGGLVVADEDTCMVNFARYFMEFTQEESCGKCVPCRVGTKAMLSTLERICVGEGQPGDVEYLLELGEEIKRASLCGLGQTAPNPVLSTIRYFRDEYEAHINKKRCPSSVCTELVSSPCQNACPIDTEAPLYISLIAQERFDEAFEVILKDNPLPSVCGRVCDAVCESKCKAGAGGGNSIAVRELKRFVIDYAIEKGIYPLAPSAEKPNGEKVAIVGSGPAGLTASYWLANNGYDTTIFEASDIPGGALTSVIPKYRLPKEKFYIDLQNIKNAGVNIKTGITIGEDISFDDLMADFAAVFIATGAHRSRELKIPNEDADGVMDALDFLKHINLNEPVRLGRRVGVIGGGNAAVDSARVALRSAGCEEVFLIYRRTRMEMPAFEEEIEALLEEGIGIHFLTTPKRVLTENGKVNGIECVKMALGDVDRSGRRRPIPIEGSEFVIELDTLLVAIGETPELSFLEDFHAIEISDWGWIVVAPETLQTSGDGVFAGGDAVTGPSVVIEAIAAGKLAAEMIDKYIRGQRLERKYEMLRPSMYISPVELPEEEMERAARPALEILPADKRIDGFEEVVSTLTQLQAVKEAQRCLRCDLTTQDGQKALEIIRRAGSD